MKSYRKYEGPIEVEGVEVEGVKVEITEKGRVTLWAPGVSLDFMPYDRGRSEEETESIARDKQDETVEFLKAFAASIRQSRS